MSEKISFSEYCKSKEYLRLAAESIPTVVKEYELTKYCKFPIVAEDEADKQYISFKPKDTISIVWEYLDPDAPVARKVVVNTDEDDDTKIQPAWGNTKLASWVSKNSRVSK